KGLPNGIQRDSTGFNWHPTGLNGTELALNGTQLARNGIELAPNGTQPARKKLRPDGPGAAESAVYAKAAGRPQPNFSRASAAPLANAFSFASATRRSSGAR